MRTGLDRLGAEAAISSRVRGARFESVVGNFVNVLPLRVRAERGLSFRDFSQRVSAAMRDATSRREYPYIDLLQGLGGGGLIVTTMAVVGDITRALISAATMKRQRSALPTCLFGCSTVSGDGTSVTWRSSTT